MIIDFDEFLGAFVAIIPKNDDSGLGRVGYVAVVWCCLPFTTLDFFNKLFFFLHNVGKESKVLTLTYSVVILTRKQAKMCDNPCQKNIFLKKVGFFSKKKNSTLIRNKKKFSILRLLDRIEFFQKKIMRYLWHFLSVTIVHHPHYYTFFLEKGFFHHISKKSLFYIPMNDLLFFYTSAQIFPNQAPKQCFQCIKTAGYSDPVGPDNGQIQEAYL
ncbi:hypothetical protein RFI_21394 [Reticulomyxa filosa]|uniref:Uncharacterized protein n=1 Tax=Reticulomyxa filosa TaxID=46433 RepID=X6MQP6_RETFI|nr:hypothetical protein RFI_21394 [Reticulomyxa filosa]|eukprot:ETO15966.1 hypothetical protein RFI_21394 [Reticulomyxa filosa]